MSIDPPVSPPQVICGVSIFVFFPARAVVLVLISRPLPISATKATNAIKLLQLVSEDFLIFILYFLLLAGLIQRAVVRLSQASSFLPTVLPGFGGWGVSYSQSADSRFSPS